VNRKMLRKLRGHRVRLRPIATRVDDRGRTLPPIDDVWWVLQSEGDAGLVVSNWRTGTRRSYQQITSETMRPTQRVGSAGFSC
jgi:hypothetical protein